MNRYTYPVLERRYKEVRATRDKLKADNKWLEREVNRLKKEVKKLQKDITEMACLLDVKIEEE